MASFLANINDSIAQIRSFENDGNYDSALILLDTVNTQLSQYILNVTDLTYTRYLRTVDDRTVKAKWTKVQGSLAQEQDLVKSLLEQTDFQQVRNKLASATSKTVPLSPSEITNTVSQNPNRPPTKQPIKRAYTIFQFLTLLGVVKADSKPRTPTGSLPKPTNSPSVVRATRSRTEKARNERSEGNRAPTVTVPRSQVTKHKEEEENKVEEEEPSSPTAEGMTTTQQ